MAGLLNSGRVLLAGGSDAGGVLATDTVLTVSSGTYATPNGPLPVGLREAPCVTLNNGRLFVAGGLGVLGPVAMAEVFTDTGFNNTQPRVIFPTGMPDQSFSYGAPIKYRLVDPELEAARLVLQYQVGTGAWKDCSGKTAVAGKGWFNDGVADVNLGDFGIKQPCYMGICVDETVGVEADFSASGG